MPRGPAGNDITATLTVGPAVVEGPDYTLFFNFTEEDVATTTVDDGKPSCVESNVTGGGSCWFVDSTLSNNWRQLRVVGGEDGADFNYIEYDQAWKFEPVSMQSYELYDVSKDKYQIHNIYDAQTDERKAELHTQLQAYLNCGAPTAGAIGKGMNMPAGKSNCP